jgi:nucleoside-diphosphate-sugar epimerase
MRLPTLIAEQMRPRVSGLRACVTGGCGFIGSHLVDALVSLGASVGVIDDLSNSTPEHVAGLAELEPERVSLVHASILDPSGLAAAVEGAGVVFHLAAMGSVPRSIEDPGRAWLVNATGTLRVLDAARAAGVRRVVYAASSSAYGDGPGGGGDAPTPKAEGMPPNPLSPYAASKLAGEHLCRAWSASYGLDTACLRYFNIFGPRQPAGSAYAAVVAAFADRLVRGERPVIHGDGMQSRDFTPVCNAVYANLLAATHPGPLAGGVFNVGLGRATSVAELARQLAARLNAPASIQPEYRPARTGDVRHSLADITRARTVLGYEPAVSFEAGLDAVCHEARAGANRRTTEGAQHAG